VRFEDDAPVAEALRADLATADVERRVASAERAGREGGARCLRPLAEALGDAELRVRIAAARSLVMLAERAHEHGDPPLAALGEAREGLTHAARDAEPMIRRAALEALVLVAGAPRDAFLRGLSDENPGVRVEAVRGLWRLADPGSGEVLLPKLEDPDHLVRYYALLAVSELEPPGFTEAIALRLGDERAEVAAEAAFLLAERGDRRAIPVLCRTLEHRDLAFEAARLLGELGDPAAASALRRCVGRWLVDPLTRLRAAASLCRAGDASGEALLLQALRSWRRPVRGFAIELLSELNAPAAYEAILAIARSRDDYHCGTAARALGRYGDGRALDLLCELLEGHPDPEVREDAARALGEIGGEGAARALERAAARDPADAVREAARAARGGA
jgi:HEAT repeat protein